MNCFLNFDFKEELQAKSSFSLLSVNFNVSYAMLKNLLIGLTTLGNTLENNEGAPV